MVVAGGLHVAHDTGPVNGRTEYTTLIILHGFVWHSGSFVKLIPIAKDYNCRLVLVHRRDYPGSAPFTQEELAPIQMKDRTREVYDFLEDLIERNGGVTPVQANGTGGMILVGWSLGSVWMNAFLAYAPSFMVGRIELPKYLKRVVCYDPSYHINGYPRLPNGCNPVFDASLGQQEREAIFNVWITGYFSHGDDLETLEQRTPLQDPRPTIEAFTSEDIASMTYPPPGTPQGSDSLLLRIGILTGVFGANRRAALYFTNGSVKDQTSDSDLWRDVELRYVHCIQGLWETVYGLRLLSAELAEARARGERGAPCPGDDGTDIYC